VGTTREEVESLIAGAMDLHVRSLVADGEPVPEPSDGVELIQLSL